MKTFVFLCIVAVAFLIAVTGNSKYYRPSKKVTYPDLNISEVTALGLGREIAACNKFCDRPASEKAGCCKLHAFYGGGECFGGVMTCYR